MPTKADDIVYFLLPDGTKVSNDPRFHMAEMYEQMMAQQENLGVVTAPDQDLQQKKVYPPQSGQPDVGAAAVGAGPDRTQAASNVQGDLDGIVHPGQSRAAAHTAREGQVGMGDEDEEDEDTAVDFDEVDKPYTEWTPAELKAEVKARRKMGREVPVDGKNNKANVAAALQADDEAAENEQ